MLWTQALSLATALGLAQLGSVAAAKEQDTVPYTPIVSLYA